MVPCLPPLGDIFGVDDAMEGISGPTAFSATAGPGAVPGTSVFELPDPPSPTGEAGGYGISGEVGGGQPSWNLSTAGGDDNVGSPSTIRVAVHGENGKDSLEDVHLLDSGNGLYDVDPILNCFSRDSDVVFLFGRWGTNDSTAGTTRGALPLVTNKGSHAQNLNKNGIEFFPISSFVASKVKVEHQELLQHTFVFFLNKILFSTVFFLLIPLGLGSPVWNGCSDALMFDHVRPACDQCLAAPKIQLVRIIWTLHCVAPNSPDDPTTNAFFHAVALCQECRKKPSNSLYV
jgi:hypothetical protein